MEIIVGLGFLVIAIDSVALIGTLLRIEKAIKGLPGYQPIQEEEEE